jgi:hypothetical protein
VKHEPTSRDPSGEGDVQLTTRRNIEAHPFFMSETCHCGAHERLGGVSHSVREGINGLPAPGPQMSLVVDEQWCPELFGKVDDITATNEKSTVRRDNGIIRK